jgi:hypothetical protein
MYTLASIHDVEAEMKTIMQSAAELYQRLWPTLKHKFPTSYRDQPQLHAFFKSSYTFYEVSPATEILTEHHMKAQLTVDEYDPNVFWLDHEHRRRDSLPLSEWVVMEDSYNLNRPSAVMYTVN